MSDDTTHSTEAAAETPSLSSSQEEFESRLKNAVKGLRESVSKEIEGRINGRLAKLEEAERVNPDAVLSEAEYKAGKAAEESAERLLQPIRDEMKENRKVISRLDQNVSAMMERELERARLRRKAKEKLAEAAKVRPSFSETGEAGVLTQNEIPASAHARTQSLIGMIEQLRQKEASTSFAPVSGKDEDAFEPAPTQLEFKEADETETGTTWRTIRVKVLSGTPGFGEKSQSKTALIAGKLSPEERRQLDVLEKQKAQVMSLLDELVAEYTAGIRNSKDYVNARSDALHVLNEINENIARITGQ